MLLHMPPQTLQLVKQSAFIVAVMGLQVSCSLDDLGWACLGGLGSGPLPTCSCCGPGSKSSHYLEEALLKVMAET